MYWTKLHSIIIMDNFYQKPKTLGLGQWPSEWQTHGPT